jgi:hypothetical protein
MREAKPVALSCRLPLVSSSSSSRSCVIARTGRDPTLDELEKETGIPQEKLDKVKGAWAETPFSLDRPVGDEDGRKFIDFDGRSIESIEFSRARKGGFTPTVMMVDGDGKLLGEPLVGIANFDFYGAYVEEMVKKAIAAVRSGAPATAEKKAQS